jgi:hypothetical protein
VQSEQLLPLATLLFFAFGVNLPLGYLRESSRKFSLHWFVLVHLSIPFIVALRSMLGFDWPLIPFTIACAVAGQVIGSRIRRRTLG